MPNLASFGGNCSPSSKPSCANVVLHDFTKLSSSVPPQLEPPKFEIALPACGGVNDRRTGYWVVGVAMPVSSADAVVAILNVEPGG